MKLAWNAFHIGLILFSEAKKEYFFYVLFIYSQWQI